MDMKFCSRCGKQLVNDAVVCTNCGCAVQVQYNLKTGKPKKESGLVTATKILLIIGTVSTSLATVPFMLLPIPLAWCLPMTLSYFNKIKRGEKISTGFKVCTLIFVSMVGGILMLCDNDQ